MTSTTCKFNVNSAIKGKDIGTLHVTIKATGVWWLRFKLNLAILLIKAGCKVAGLKYDGEEK